MASSNPSLDVAARNFKVPSAKDELIAWADRKRELGRPVVSEQQMKLNLSFVLGNQWVTWDERAMRYNRVTVDTRDPNAPVRLTANKIGSMTERTVAKLTKENQVPEARPVSDNDNDVSSARVGTRIIDSELTRLHWRLWLSEFMFWPTVLGWSYAHIYWDADKGESLGFDPDDDESELFEGNICLDIVPAAELMVEPSAKNMEQARWAIRSTVMTRETAWDRWGVELEGGARMSLAQEVQTLRREMADPVANHDEWVEVHQLWMVPCKAAPKGLVLTWSGQTLIERLDAFPYEHKCVPFVQCNLLPGLGTREGRTWVNDVIPLQTDYNDALSREATIRRQLTPKLLAAVGQFDPQRVTSRVETLLYNPIGPEPKWIEPNSAWAQQFEVGMNRDAADIGERAGINDASAGQAASSAPAAAILALQEADDTKLALSAVQLASFVSKIGWHILMLAKQFWTEERTIRTWSDENVLEAYRYMGSDVADQLDVHISSESALPRSKAARVQLLMELQARMPDLMDAQTLIRMLDLPGTDFLVRTLDADTRRQQREIVAMLDGEQPVVQPFDNHVIHLNQLNNFRKSIDYEKLPPEAKARFDAHAAVHESLILQQLGMASPIGNPTVDPMAGEQAAAAAAGPAAGRPPVGSAYNAPMYTNQATGVPNSPLAVASGQAPSPLADSAIARKAGIGQGAGHQGRVPGVSADNQAARTGM